MLASSEDERQPDSTLNNEIFDLKIYKPTFFPQHIFGEFVWIP